ncbi:MAG: glycosyltransferase family 2 protein [Candidatus Ozemobacteraceae bacterium]
MSMIPYQLTVIIPTYNRLDSLAELLEALYRQSYPLFRIVLVNDAGVPVERVCALYPELDITILNLKDNRKNAHAMNCGLESAKSEYIMLCDDDDLLLPSHIERMLQGIGDSDLLYSDAEIVEYSLDNNRTRHPEKRFVFAYTLDLPAMRKFSTFIPSGCLYRRSLHEKIGLFDSDLYCYWDWDFFLRVAAVGSVKRLAIAGVMYAFSPTSGNQTAQHENMRPYLDRLCAKHQLGQLPTANFFTLLSEPAVQKLKAETEILWNGEPFIPRKNLP